VTETLSQVRPVAHFCPQPPQFASSDEMLTQAPLQQRCASEVPHEAPSARFVVEHLLLVQAAT
jgi:hypothetical protein